MLATTSHDIDRDGWDTRAGAGRLDMAAVMHAFAGIVSITSPRNDTAVAGYRVPIIGTVALPYFASYDVAIGYGSDEAVWEAVRTQPGLAIAAVLDRANRNRPQTS